MGENGRYFLYCILLFLIVIYLFILFGFRREREREGYPRSDKTTPTASRFVQVGPSHEFPVSVTVLHATFPFPLLYSVSVD